MSRLKCFHSTDFPYERGLCLSVCLASFYLKVSIQLISPTRGDSGSLVLKLKVPARFHSTDFPYERGLGMKRRSHFWQDLEWVSIQLISPTRGDTVGYREKASRCHSVSIQLISPTRGDSVMGCLHHILGSLYVSIQLISPTRGDYKVQLWQGRWANVSIQLISPTRGDIKAN